MSIPPAALFLRTPTGNAGTTMTQLWEVLYSIFGTLILYGGTSVGLLALSMYLEDRVDEKHKRLTDELRALFETEDVEERLLVRKPQGSHLESISWPPPHEDLMEISFDEKNKEILLLIPAPPIKGETMRHKDLI